MSNALWKYEQDQRDFYFDLSQQPEIIGGQTVTGASTITSDPVGLSFTSPDIASPKVHFTISGGTGGTTYMVESLVTFSGGGIIQVCEKLDVLTC